MNQYFVITKINVELAWRAEDSSCVSKVNPIYCVGDGVTLKEYSSNSFPTPARAVTDIFCNRAVEYLEKIYPKIDLNKIIESFNYSNYYIKEYYRKHDEIQYKFGNTGAVVAIKENIIIGGRFLDSGFAIIRKGKVVFKTPEFWSWKKENTPNKLYPYISENDKLDDLLQTYEISFDKGDYLLLYTDGYEKYLSLDDFLSIFNEESLDLVKEGVLMLDLSKSKTGLKEYADERTLLVVKL